MGGRRNQLSIASSSTEAEYVALSEAAREAKWLQTLYEEPRFDQKDPVLLFGDNRGSLAMAKNPQFHKRSKHRNPIVQEDGIELKDVEIPKTRPTVY